MAAVVTKLAVRIARKDFTVVAAEKFDFIVDVAVHVFG